MIRGAPSLDSGVVSDLRRLASRYFSRCGSYVFQGQPALQSLARNCERANSTPVIGIDIIYHLRYYYVCPPPRAHLLTFADSALARSSSDLAIEE